MKLWMSSEASRDVATALRKTRNEIEQIVNSSLANRDYGEGVRQWAFIAIVLPTDMHQEYPERLKYRKSDRSVEFRLHIDWTRSKRAMK
jgi:Immunity protein 44